MCMCVCEFVTAFATTCLHCVTMFAPWRSSCPSLPVGPFESRPLQQSLCVCVCPFVSRSFATKPMCCIPCFFHNPCHHHTCTHMIVVTTPTRTRLLSPPHLHAHDPCHPQTSTHTILVTTTPTRTQSFSPPHPHAHNPCYHTHPHAHDPCRHTHTHTQSLSPYPHARTDPCRQAERGGRQPHTEVLYPGPAPTTEPPGQGNVP